MLIDERIGIVGFVSTVFIVTGHDILLFKELLQASLAESNRTASFYIKYVEAPFYGKQKWDLRRAQTTGLIL